MSTVPSGQRWYCVQTKPRTEARALENLERQAFECLLPRIRRPAPVARLRRQKTVVEPLFPRYLFLRADPHAQSLAPIRSTTGVIGLVRFANQPAQVPDDIVARLRLDADPEGVIEPVRAEFRPGDPVRIVDGPFLGLPAVYAQASGEQRTIVLLQLLGSERKIMLPRDALQAMAAGLAT